jgi:mRNA interferase MazF
VKTPGQVVLFRFPHTDLAEGKLRPALLLSAVPGQFDDWLICMITSQLRHLVEGFDEVIRPIDNDYADSGLKTESRVRLGRLAVIDGATLFGAIGRLSPGRFERIRHKVADWVLGELPV